MKKFFKSILIIAILLCIAWVTFAYVTKPSNDRTWVTDNAILPHSVTNGDLMTIYNVRNYSYISPLEFTPAYYDKTYNLAELTSVDFIVAPFNPPTAHTFVSFGFKDGSHVAISIEARREVDESYSVLKGMFRQFEMMYVVADEADVLKLRTNHRADGDVYLYPIKVSQAKARALFTDMMNQANALYRKPQFYNSITNNCTNALVQHVNNIADEEAQIGFSWKYVLPAYSDKLVYDRGLINDDGEFEELKAKYLITPKAKSCGDAVDFSACIRN